MESIAMAHIPDLDLKLIYVFEALLKLRNVSRAAEELDMSQPALSQALAKLRRLFGDSLFVHLRGHDADTARTLAVGTAAGDGDDLP